MARRKEPAQKSKGCKPMLHGNGNKCIQKEIFNLEPFHILAETQLILQGYYWAITTDK